MSVGADEAELYRLRTATDTTWAGQAAYGRRDTFGHRVWAVLSMIGSLVLPVLLLISALASVYLYVATPLPAAADDLAGSGHWFTTGYAVLPLAFFSIQLTNRRYGPTYALLQVIFAAAAIVAALVFSLDSFRGIVPAAAEPSMRVASAFGVAFFIASFLSILTFDGSRGPRWWVAPLVGALTSGIVFSTLFWPLAYAGAPGPWTDRMLIDLGFMAASSLLLLAPYWLLRGLVPPLSGFGGY